MPFKKPFVVSTEEVNSFGFVMKTEGIGLTTAKTNCPCYYEHRTWEIPLGHWENFRIENNKLIADLIINGDNEREKNYIKKIENGDIKGATIGADPIKWNSDAAQLKQGQTAPTCEECELYEISITGLPANKGALALKHEGSLISLTANTQNIIPDLKQETDMKQIALSLGLAESATEQQCTDAIKVLLSKSANAEAMQKVIEENVASELEGDKKEFFISLSKTNVSEAMKFLSLNKKETPEGGEAAATTATTATTVKKDVKVSEMIQLGKNGGGSAAPTEGKDSFDYLQKHNPVELKRIHKDEPEKYVQLAKEYSNGVRYTGK